MRRTILFALCACAFAHNHIASVPTEPGEGGGAAPVLAAEVQVAVIDAFDDDAHEDISDRRQAAIDTFAPFLVGEGGEQVDTTEWLEWVDAYLDEVEGVGITDPGVIDRDNKTGSAVYKLRRLGSPVAHAAPAMCWRPDLYTNALQNFAEELAGGDLDAVQVWVFWDANTLRVYVPDAPTSFRLTADMLVDDGPQVG